jgi:hypothetical protein
MRSFASPHQQWSFCKKWKALVTSQQVQVTGNAVFGVVAWRVHVCVYVCACVVDG